MTSWLPTLPAERTNALSAEVRGNIQALASGLYGVNFVPNGEGLIWPLSTMPAHWGVWSPGFTPTVARETGGAFQKRQGWSTKITGHGSGESAIVYSALASADFHTGWIGQDIHVGEWIYSTDPTAARLVIDFFPSGSSSPIYSTYDAGSSTWNWKSLSTQVPANATRILVGRSCGASKVGYFWGHSGWFYGVPPQDWVPCPAQTGTLWFPFPGAQTTDADYEFWQFEFSRPAIVLGSKAICRTGPVGSAFTYNVGKLTTAPATYSALYTSNLEIAAAAKRGDAAVFEPTSATYNDRCFDGRVAVGGSATAATILGIKRLAAGGTPAQDVKVGVVTMQYLDALASWKRAAAF